MKILVTGAHGFLGRSLLRLRNGIEWIGCGRGQEPVDEKPYHPLESYGQREVAALLASERPAWVINTAAMTNVDRCEVDRESARQANLELVEGLVAACRETGTGLVQLSTDYVFDGESGPYSEEDETHPLSYYGQLKLDSEKRVLAGLERAIVVRTLWLYGYVPETGNNFVTWVIGALHRGEGVKVFADQWGNPTYVHDLARALADLCQRGTRGLFHMGGTSFMTRYELVLELVRFFALDAAMIEPISTRTAGLKAPRPLRSGLRTERIEAELDGRPLSFTEGLEDMSGQEIFRRDFTHLF